MTTVLFEIDGKPTPINDCSWLMYAPCGCLCGACVVSDDSMTVEEAWQSLVPSAEQRRRDAKAGFRVEAGLRSAARAMAAECPHTPKWGIEKTPIPHGHRWMRKCEVGARGSRTHLVPVVAIERRMDLRAPVTTALCGVETWYWSKDYWETTDIPECSRCQKLAVAL